MRLRCPPSTSRRVKASSPSARMQPVAAKSRGAKKKKTASTRFHTAVAALTHQRSVLEQELANCRARHSSLTARTRMVSQWLDVLDLQSQPPQGSCAAEDEQLEQELLAVRALLLQPGGSQSNSSASEGSTDPPGSPAAAAAAAAAAGEAPCLDPMLQTIGQPGDAVALFRDLASRQLLPGVETQTALQHLEHHKELAQKLGVQLVQLECLADSAKRVKVLDNIKQLLDRHYHILWSLIVCGKRDVVDATKAFDLEAGCLLSPDSPHIDNQASIAASVLPALELSEEQEDTTAYAMELCASLMTPIAAEISQIQQQLNVCITSSSSSSSSGSSSANSGEDSGSSGLDAGSPGAAAEVDAAAGGPERALAKARLEQQQKLLSRLSVLLRKQYHVVAATTCIFLNSLTWVQAAKMIVCRWPYTASMQYVAKAVWVAQQARVQRQLQGMGPTGSSPTPAPPVSGGSGVVGLGQGSRGSTAGPAGGSAGGRGTAQLQH